MECEQVRQQLTDFLIGVDDPDVREHLERCAACREEAASLERIWSGLAHIPAAAPNSAVLRARFASMLEGYEHGRDGANASARWDWMNGWLARWFVAARGGVRVARPWRRGRTCRAAGGRAGA